MRRMHELGCNRDAALAACDPHRVKLGPIAHHGQPAMMCDGPALLDLFLSHERVSVPVRRVSVANPMKVTVHVQLVRHNHVVATHTLKGVSTVRHLEYI